MSEEKKAQTKAEEKLRQEVKDRRSMAIYTVVAVAVVVAAVAMMFWNSGVLQRNVTALEVGGTKYTAVDLQYLYDNLYTNYAGQYAFDSSSSVKKQVYDQETGQSWYDYLMGEAVKQAALAAQARSEGHTLSQEAQEQLDSTLAQLNSSWMSYGYANRDAFIKANFGAYMTYDRMASLMELQCLASDYASARLDAVSHPESDYDAYYNEHADELDTIVYTQFTFQAQAPTTDEQGQPVDMTDAEKAAKLEELKPQQKALAEEFKAKLEAGTSPEALEEEYSDRLYNSSISRRTTGSNASYSTYGDWLLDASRRTGDITLSENDTGSACYYYVAIFEDRFRDEQPTHNVRHLLVRAGSANTADPTPEEYDVAEEKAQSLLDEWKFGEANEDTFAALVSANSDDTGSASTGGLISNITSDSSYVQAFKDWATDASRREGDVELVKTEYGWHIMYYVSTGDPTWRQTVGAQLRDQDYEQLTAEVSQNWNASQGMGMNFVNE